MKKLFLVVSFLMIITNLQAQKLYLSGMYKDGFLKYLNNGKYQETPLNLNDFTYDDNTEIVVFGEFKKDEDGNSFFNIEREDQAVQLVSGNYKKVKYTCPATPDEGEITQSNGRKIYYSSLVPLNPQGNISVTKADWGVKVCNNKTYSMYYIQEIKIGTGSTAQTRNPSTPIRPQVVNTTINPISEGNIGSLLTANEAKEALDFHNKARNDVGVAPLTWSPEISKYAQEWANNLAANGCQLQHRSSAQNTKGYGENIGMGYSGYNALSASKAWYSEISQFQNVVLDQNNWYKAGHYSQMVWRNTTHLGIGVAKCSNGATIVVGNYNPPGNYMGQKAY